MSDKDYGDKLDDCISSLKSHTNSKSQFAGFSRFYYKQVNLSKHINHP